MYVLDKADCVKPRVVQSLAPQVSDLKLESVTYAKETDSIKSTVEKIVEHIGRSIPVVGKSDNLIGVVSISDLMPSIIDYRDRSFLKNTKTPFGNLIVGLELKAIQEYPMEKDQRDYSIEGRIIMYGEDQSLEGVSPKDILICHKDIYRSGHIKECMAGHLIIVGVENDDICVEADERRCVYTTGFSLFVVAQRIHHLAQIKDVVTKDSLEYFTTYETLDDVKKNMMTSKFRRFPVVDEKGRIKGMISKSNLIDPPSKKAIMVDHNEMKQSIFGIEDITLVEVIDHHRVADIQTIQPLYFRIEPVGSTATIVAGMYLENDVELNWQISVLLLSAIYSDTLLFKSPTTTKRDIEIARILELKTGYDIKHHGFSMIRAGSQLEGISCEKILMNDLKRFMFGEHKVAISQRNTNDYDGFYLIYVEVFEAMHVYCQKEQVDLFVLMVTDIISGGSEIISVGKSKWIADQAFGLDGSEHTIFKEGVFSRKKNKWFLC